MVAVSLALDYFKAFYQGLESVDRFRIMLIKASSGKLLASPTGGAPIGGVVAGVPADLRDATRPSFVK